MEFFVCSVCHLTFPMTLNAFGLKDVPVCSQCYEKVPKTFSETKEKSTVTFTVETGQDNSSE